MEGEHPPEQPKGNPVPRSRIPAGHRSCLAHPLQLLGFLGMEFGKCQLVRGSVCHLRAVLLARELQPEGSEGKMCICGDAAASHGGGRLSGECGGAN